MFYLILYLVRIILIIKKYNNYVILDNTSIISSGESVHIKGTANTTKCLEIIDIFLKTADDNWCYPKPCAIGATYQPPVMDTEFYAIAAFVFAPTYLNASDSMGRLNISALKSNALKYCSKVNKILWFLGLSQCRFKYYTFGDYHTLFCACTITANKNMP